MFCPVLELFSIEPEEVEFALEGLAYFMLHIAKTNAVTQEAFESIYETTGLKPAFAPGLFQVITVQLPQIRDLLTSENNRGNLSFKDLDWRLNFVTATRQKQKMLQPKYTCKLDLE